MAHYLRSLKFAPSTAAGVAAAGTGQAFDAGRHEDTAVRFVPDRVADDQFIAAGQGVLADVRPAGPPVFFSEAQ